ncbi:DUF4376 domain-containing protein [Pseudomonas monteilii]|uniref:DUF4376 domain-containing protein n=1 Tax=Pseudomonas monteilii TaxID=76759 RepID=UPI0018A58779|nr:DUF4376 domain-containing protein [Pseudomonas monteilii]BBV97895.1 hypothetical protein STW0522PSE72_32460 [Pseudomonas monteilii]
MILYQWDVSGLFTGQVEVEEDSALPMRSTPTKPPKLTGTQVARWTGAGWEKLASAPEPEPLPEPDWLALIAARRYQAEIGGIELAGLPIATDDRSKLLINGAAARAARDSGYTLKWKTDEGFIDLPADQVLTMADAVADHVQACFDREAELQVAVADRSITVEMIDQDWPHQ